MTDVEIDAERQTQVANSPKPSAEESPFALD
jgi:hypothetical protein